MGYRYLAGFEVDLRRLVGPTKKEGDTGACLHEEPHQGETQQWRRRRGYGLFEGHPHMPLGQNAHEGSMQASNMQPHAGEND